MRPSLLACLISLFGVLGATTTNAQVIQWEYFTSPGSLKCINICSDGGYIATGSIPNTAYDDDIWLVRLSPEGELLWEGTYGADEVFGKYSRDSGYEVQETSDGGFLVVGRDHNINNATSHYVLKTDANGIKEWDLLYGGLYSWEATGVEASDGRIIVAANMGYVTYSRSVVILSITPPASPGDAPLMQQYPLYEVPGVYEREARSIVQTDDGYFMLAGQAKPKDGSGQSDMWVAKLNIQPTSLTVMWEKIYGDAGGNDNALCVLPTADNGFMLAGMWDDYDASLLKIDPFGQPVWPTIFKLQRGIVVRDLVPEADGGYLLTSSDYLIKTDSDGKELWFGRLLGTTLYSLKRTEDGYVGVGVKSATPWIVKFTLNSPPVAEAGPNQLVHVEAGASASVTLNGSESTDPDGDSLSYQWSENGLLLGSASMVTVSLKAGQHDIVLTVTDSKGATSVDSTRVTVNTVPIANAGPDQLIQVEDGNTASVSLDGSGSSDPDGTSLTHTWYESGTILGSGVNPSISLLLGQHDIELKVGDVWGAMSSDWVRVVLNAVPVANAGIDQTAQAITVDGWATVYLDGSGSYDLEADPLDFLWSENGTTLGYQSLMSVSLPLGQHQILLTVTDTKQGTSTDTVFIEVIATPEGIEGLLDEAITAPDSQVSSQEENYLRNLLTGAAGALKDGDIDAADRYLDRFKDRIVLFRDKGNLSPEAAEILIGAADATLNTL